MTNEQAKQWREEFCMIALGAGYDLKEGFTQLFAYENTQLAWRIFCAAKQSSQSIIDAQAQEIETLKRKLAEQQAAVKRAFDISPIEHIKRPDGAGVVTVYAIMPELLDSGAEELTNLLYEAKQQGIEEGRRMEREVKLTTEEIESCFPNGAVSLEDGWIGVTAQWLHDFAAAIRAKGNK